MSKVLKAGCFFLRPKEHTIAIVYREQQQDYSFPKGHLEEGESLLECANRETEEETKRKCILLEEKPIYLENYITPGGEDVEMHYFLAKDGGESDNSSLDTHPTIWVPYEEVMDLLSYDGLKTVWKNVETKVKDYFE